MSEDNQESMDGPEKVSEEFKQQSNKYRLLGNEAMTKKDYNAAVEHYSKAISYDPKNHIFFSNRSAAYLALNKKNEALEDSQTCIDISPNWAKGYIRLGHSLIELGKFNEAKEALEKGLEVNKNNDNIKKHTAGLKALLKQLEIKELEAKNADFFKSLKGRWYGKLPEDLGGYYQELNFVDINTCVVTIMDRIVKSKTKLNANKKPVWLDISIDLEPQEWITDANGNQVKVDLVKYIVDVVDDELWLCSNFEESGVRPTTFEGQAFVKMQKGSRPSLTKETIEKVKAMTIEQRINAYITEALELFQPQQRLMPNEDDSEELKKQISTENIKFQAKNYEITRKYGSTIENSVRDLLLGTKTAVNETQTVLVQRLKVKMQNANLLPADNDILEFQERQKDYSGELLAKKLYEEKISEMKKEEKVAEVEKEVEPEKGVVFTKHDILLVTGIALGVAATGLGIFAMLRNRNE